MLPSRTDPRPGRSGDAPAAAAAAHSVLLRLRSILTRPIRLERRGIDWHFVFEPAPRAIALPRATSSSGNHPPRRGDAMPSMTGEQVTEVCANLRALLGGVIGRHPQLPSLALLERALVKGGARGIDDVPAAVLRHAAQSLDTLELDHYGPGLVLLRRRIEQVLRRRHGDRHTRDPMPPVLESTMPAALGYEHTRDFSDSLTEFIDIDRMFAAQDR